MTGFETSGASAAGPTAAKPAENTDTHQPTAGVIEELSGALSSARTLLSNFLDLLSLEARRAGIALAWMIVCGVVAAVMIVTAWVGLMLAVAMELISLGFPTPAAIIVVAVINGGAGAMLIYLCIDMSQALLFPAARRQVARQSPVKASEP
jgi:hypothetical protein